MTARTFLPTIAGLVLAGHVSRAEAACAAPAHVADVEAAMGEAETAYGKDLPAFQAASTRAFALLPCVADAIEPSVAARYHRVVGLVAYVARDPASEISAFAAARSVDPAYSFPETMVPAGNPLRQDYLAVDVSGTASTAVPAPATGEVRLDGKAAAARPAEWPTLFQLVGIDGHVLTSAYLLASDPLPAFALATVPAAVTAPGPAPIAVAADTVASAHEATPTGPAPGPTSHRGGRALALGSLGAAILAGGAYTGATLAAQDFRTNDHTDAEYGALRTDANALVLATAGLSALATGLAIGAVVTLPW